MNLPPGRSIGERCPANAGHTVEEYRVSSRNKEILLKKFDLLLPLMKFYGIILIEREIKV